MKLKKSHKNKKIIKKNYNYGLGILKVLFALSVIRSHFFNEKSTKNKILLFFIYRFKTIHVPSFFIMSFYFLHKELILINFKLFIKRLERLLIPYLGWPIIMYFLNNYIITKLFNIKVKYTFEDLKIQLLWGYNYFRQFWFLWDLIFMTITFYILMFIFQKKHLFFIQLFGFFGYILQYSGKNFIFYKSLGVDKNGTLGRLCEMAPFASTGFTLASLNIINILQK